jgi:hypothetical protein
MKKIKNYMKTLVCLVVLGLVSVSAFAQSYEINVHRNDGVSTKILSSVVDSITFKKVDASQPQAYSTYTVPGFDDVWLVAGSQYLQDNIWPKVYTSDDSFAGGAVAYHNFSVYNLVGTIVETTPTWFSFKTTEKTKLARLQYYHYFPYRNSCPLFWEVWAYTGNDVPTAAEGWDNWVKIGEGDNNSLATVADKTTAYPLGETLDFAKADVPAAQYYRFKCLENWTKKVGAIPATNPTRTHFAISEMLLWSYVE